MTGKEIGVFNFGCVVLGELQVKVSDCTAEGNRCLWCLCKQGKKKFLSFFLWSINYVPKS